MMIKAYSVCWNATRSADQVYVILIIMWSTHSPWEREYADPQVIWSGVRQIFGQAEEPMGWMCSSSVWGLKYSSFLSAVKNDTLVSSTPTERSRDAIFNSQWLYIEDLQSTFLLSGSQKGTSNTEHKSRNLESVIWEDCLKSCTDRQCSL